MPWAQIPAQIANGTPTWERLRHVFDSTSFAAFAPGLGVRFNKPSRPDRTFDIGAVYRMTADYELEMPYTSGLTWDPRSGAFLPSSRSTSTQRVTVTMPCTSPVVSMQAIDVAASIR